MTDTPITERQHYWLDDIRAADAFDGSMAYYARSEGQTPQELYSWKSILARRRLLSERATFEKASGFVRVIAPTRPPLGMSLVLPNGVRLEWHGDLGPEQLEALALTASRLQ